MKLIIIANRLPMKVNRIENNQLEFVRSVGGLTTGLESLTLDVDIHWIGWPGTYAESIEEEQFIEKHLLSFNFHPVFLSNEQIDNYYNGYSNSTLWPLCHYFYNYIEFESNYWTFYKEVNELFTSKAIEIINPGDIVWVQDYQLMLVPNLVRKKVENLSIGYFHHIPFPSYELFRVLPERAEILKGLLGADLVGFHTHDYMRHFVSAVERVLDLRYSLEQVNLNNRISFVDAFPMGINYELYHHSSELESVKTKIQLLKNNFEKFKIILSVDRLDYSKGILHRVKGFSAFLENNPEYHEKVSLIMIVVESRDNVESYADLKKQIDESIGTINGRFSSINWTPIHYFYQGFGFEELTAFYHLSDIALVTPLRDGMNLVAKEYIASKKNTPGVLILSEMAGAAIELSDAIIINPNNINEIEKAIVLALEMPEEEKWIRQNSMQKIIKSKSINYWAQNFVNQLIQIRTKNNDLTIEKIDAESKELMRQEYMKARKRLFILDYDGTLAAFRSKPEDANPTPEIYSILEKLLENKMNKVVISSGRDKDTLQKWFPDKRIYLAAEHGAFNRENGIWIDLIGKETPWNDEILELLTLFTDKTPKSRIEIKKSTLVWHYRNVDSWIATLREQQLFEALITPCSLIGLQIMRGNKIIEIKSPLHTKGSEALRLLKKDNYEFIFAIGDDTTDEDTFEVLPDFSFTVKVGTISNFARYSLNSQSKVLPLIADIIAE